MLREVIFAVVILGVTFCSEGFTLGQNPDCKLPLQPVRYGFFAPLVFTADGKFAFASDDDILLSAGERVTISCEPGLFKSFPDKRTLKAKCVQGEELELEDGKQETWSKSFACELRAVEEVFASRLAGCPQEAESIEFGFLNPHTQTSNIVGEVCYSAQEGRTIFVHAKDSSVLKTESMNYLKSGRHPEGRNKISLFRALRHDNVHNLLEGKLGSHRVPMMGSRPLLTGFMLDNPQLHLITRLTWNYIVSYNDETLKEWEILQKGVQKLNNKEEIWAGTSGVQQLKDSSGHSFDFYLEEKKFPVPKYYWLVVKEEDRTVGILFNNTPKSLRTSGEEHQTCPGHCADIPWLSDLKESDDPEALHCCSLDKLRQIVPEIPDISTDSSTSSIKADKTI
ncbi:uncharacterized protein LOC132263043 [Phlebotomus argentipes]|uniref:uncharacterized protein LOC132263043 n=1 Tax=Phlebotomus argentipes TaxID=94469 RepID=UPI0028935F67|nr:uncharacterized protein LOC132263043 [Phlebotomus argentipes]